MIKNGKTVSTRRFDEGSIVKLEMGSERVAILQNDLSVGVNYKLSIFDTNGELKKTHNFDASIRDIEVFDDSVFVLTHTELFVFTEGKELKKISLDGDYKDVGVFAKDCVILCSESQAQIRLLEQ